MYFRKAKNHRVMRTIVCTLTVCTLVAFGNTLTASSSLPVTDPCDAISDYLTPAHVTLSYEAAFGESCIEISTTLDFGTDGFINELDEEGTVLATYEYSIAASGAQCLLSSAQGSCNAQVLEFNGDMSAISMTHDGETATLTTLAVTGCTDSEACNYDADAQTDDGSCEYISCATTVIQCYVWDDINGNGKQNGNESGIEGVTVRLRRANGSQLMSTTTDENGIATFLNVEQDVKLDFEKKNNNHAFTIANAVGVNESQDSDADRNSGETEIFTPGASTTMYDCGQWSPGSVDAYVWDDINGDGKQNGNESGIEGVQVKLRRSNGSVISTANTDATGHAIFTGLVPADQDVKLSFARKNNDHAYTHVNAVNTNENNDSDADGDNNGFTGTFRTTQGAHLITNQDCGQWSPGTVNALVWDDINGDGKKNGNETGIEGVQVKLRRANNSVIQTVSTGPDGIATFSGNVPADEPYKLSFALKNSNHAYTHLNAANTSESNDSDADGDNNGLTATFEADRGADVQNNIDCGQWSPGSVTALAWDDVNGDGKRNGNEVGIAGVQVKLRRSNNSVIQTLTTGADGLVEFQDNVPAGQNVRMQFIAPNGYALTESNAANSHENNDSDADPNNNGYTDFFATTKGAHLITDQDAGLFAPGTITTRFWLDANGNGKQNGNEVSIQGITAKLRRLNGSVISTQTSDVMGEVIFPNVPADQGVRIQVILSGNNCGLTFKDKSGVGESQDSDFDQTTLYTDTIFMTSGSQNLTTVDCGVWQDDTDSDNDGTPNCDEPCPVDPNKTDPGVCGCNVADTDSDGDGIEDCNDDCSDETAFNYDFVPTESCVYTCGEISDPLVFESIELLSYPSGPDAADGEVSIVYSGSKGPYTLVLTDMFEEAASVELDVDTELDMVPAGAWAVTLQDRNGCTADAPMITTEEESTGSPVVLTLFVTYEHCDEVPE